MTIPKHLLLLAAATVSTLFAVSAQAQIWDEDEESVLTVGEEVFAAGEELTLGGNSGLTWAAGNTVLVNEPSGGVFAMGNVIKCCKERRVPCSSPDPTSMSRVRSQGRFMPLVKMSSWMLITGAARYSPLGAISASEGKRRAART